MYIPESPVLEWIELKLIDIDNHFPDKSLTREEEIEIILYDEMIKSIRPGHVCEKCWKKDQELYDKYYDSNDDFEIRLL